MKLVAIVPLLIAIPAAGTAAPLCRDAKGLFTPCTPAEASRRHDVASRRHASSPVSPVRASDKPATVVSRGVGPAHRERQPAISTGRLCRDGKGLFTPCAR